MSTDRSKRRPNLLILFPDQYRAQAQGHRGQDPVRTPHIDRLAAEGTDCFNTFSNYPLCSPARGMWHSGRYPFSNGVISNCHSGHTEYGIYLKESERCLSDVLAEAGYDLGYIGKWHLDSPTEPFVCPPEAWDKQVWDTFTPPGPKRHGHSFWYSYGGYNDHLRPHYWRDDVQDRIDVEEWSPRHETDVAIHYIQNSGGTERDSLRPFALTLSWNPPHPPHNMVPEEYLEPYQGCTVQDLLRNPNVDHGRAPQAGESVKGYFGAITGIDDQVGRLLRCLREEGLEEDTLVVFSSDHGEMMGSHGRMQKSIWHQESMGVPFLLRQPGKIPVGKRCDVLLGMPDVMPTILGLLGLGSHVPGSVEGSDFSPAILGKDQARPDALLYMNALPELRAVVEWVEAGTPQSSMYEAATLAALRDDPDDTSKLIALLSQNPIGSRGVRSRTHTYVVTRAPGQPEEHGLYNNATDPGELTNCYADEQDAAEHHRNLLRELLERTNDPWARVRSRTLSC